MKAVRETSQALQRVKVGLTGLAAVILLIGLASAIMRTATRQPAIAAAGAARPDVVANIAEGNSVADAGGEPLAEFGVAPSAGNTAAPAAGGAQ